MSEEEPGEAQGVALIYQAGAGEAAVDQEEGGLARACARGDNSSGRSSRKGTTWGVGWAGTVDLGPGAVGLFSFFYFFLFSFFTASVLFI